MRGGGGVHDGVAAVLEILSWTCYLTVEHALEFMGNILHRKLMSLGKSNNYFCSTLNDFRIERCDYNNNRMNLHNIRHKLMLTTCMYNALLMLQYQQRPTLVEETDMSETMRRVLKSEMQTKCVCETRMPPMEKNQNRTKNPLLMTHYQAIKKLIFFTEIGKLILGTAMGTFFLLNRNSYLQYT